MSPKRTSRGDKFSLFGTVVSVQQLMLLAQLKPTSTPQTASVLVHCFITGWFHPPNGTKSSKDAMLFPCVYHRGNGLPFVQESPMIEVHWALLVTTPTVWLSKSAWLTKPSKNCWLALLEGPHLPSTSSQKVSYLLPEDLRYATVLCT